MADVLVIGAGIIGAAAARAFSRQGAEVLVLDRGAAASATSARCEGNLLVSDKVPGPDLELALRSHALWPALAAELDEELGPAFPSLEYQPKGGLVVATTEPGASALSGFSAAQRAAGVAAEQLTDNQAHQLEPLLTAELTAAVHYPQDAQVQPTIATESMLASARRAGAAVHTDVDARAPLVHHGALVGVRTSKGDYRAPVVVLAAGPWSGTVSALFGTPLPVQPRRGVLLVTARTRHAINRKVYDADYVGAVESGDPSLQTSSVVESTAAGTVLIGSSRERVGFDDALDVAVIRELARKAIRLFPFLAAVPMMRSYSGFRPYLPDHLPVIGADPRLPGLWHATGHEGAGIGLAPATAELLTALVTRSSPAIDPAPYAVTRPSLARHLAQAA